MAFLSDCGPETSKSSNEHLPAEVDVRLHPDVVNRDAIVLQRLGQIVHADTLLPDVSSVIAVTHTALVRVLVDAKDGVGVGRPRRGQAQPDVILYVRPEDVALQVSVVPVR